MDEEEQVVLYDEFGNYIGPELEDNDDDSGSGGSDSDSDSSASSSASDDEDNDVRMDQDDGKRKDDEEDEDDDDDDDDDEDKSQAIVLHEDKNYFPSASEVFGQAEVLVEDEDTQPLEQPIIAPIRHKTFLVDEQELPPTSFDVKYLAGLMDNPRLVRNVAVVGHLHHGKTSLVDLLVQQTHRKKWDLTRQVRWTDSRIDEQERGMSIKASPVSLVAGALDDKSFLLNLYDTPGHVNFSDEQAAAVRACDGVVVVVDAVEGVMMQTMRSIKYAVQEQQRVALVINKIDRLITELKIPPVHAYYKLHAIIADVNAILRRCGSKNKVSVTGGTVCFASAMHGWMFSVLSYAQASLGGSSTDSDVKQFARRLWGDVYLLKNRRFGKKPEHSGHQRTFVQYILEPLYKIYSYVLSMEGKNLSAMLSEIGVSLSKRQLSLDPKPLLKLVLSRFFGKQNCFVEMIARHLPSPLEAARTKVEHTYTGALNTDVARAMIACDPKGPLAVQVVKLYPRTDCSAFDAFARVLSGTLRTDDKVRVLGEGFSVDDPEEMRVQTVTKLWIYQSRYRIPVNRATAGNWILIEGVDESITKTATIVTADTKAISDDDLAIFRSLQFDNVSTLKVAIEPINPSELPKMLDGLRKVDKTYPLSVTRMEESGEHVVIGTGEVYMDCLLHDLRRMYSEIEIKVADPVSTFCETVHETSSLPCFADSPNGRNRLTMMAEPLDETIARDIERRVVRIKEWDVEQTAAFFQEQYDWDLLASRSIWSFGPDVEYGPNILCDDTLPSVTDKERLESVRDDIVQGFVWGTRNGPLCEEPVRNVKFKIVDAQLADDPTERRGNEIVPTSRRSAFSSFLLAAPKLMEPILNVEIQAPGDCDKAIDRVLMLRRGRRTSRVPIAGTPLFKIQAFVPVIESFGFETDLRTHTQGAAFCMSVFDHWDVVPGDPLDKTIVLRPLEPAPIQHLAREFMIKTRRRKGLNEDVSINKFFDDDMLLELAKQDVMDEEQQDDVI